jgi:hydrogenase assembly chaperone HypC/HupF
MCLSFPGLVVAVDATGATIDTEGRQRRASTLLAPDLAVGEWVFVSAGTVIDRLEADEAAYIRASLLAAIAAERAGPFVTAWQEEPR